MDILKALRNEESKFLQQLDNAKQQLETVRSAIKVLSGKGIATGGKRRKMSSATRRKIAAAARARWAKIKAKRS